LLAWEAHTLGRIREGKYSMRKHGLSRAGAASALLQHPELHVAHLANTSWLFAHGDASGELKQHWAKRFSGVLCTPRLFLQFVEQRLGFLQVGGVKALGEPGVERCQ
jgi:hypothetical protein